MKNKITFKHLIFIILVYCALSSIILITDKKEPDRLVFDIAFPKTDEEEPDKEISEIEELVTYSPIIDTANTYTQIIFTPKIITGIDIWMRVPENVTPSTYTLSFYKPDGTLIFAQDFSSEDISKEGYTTIIFDDFKLAEGKQYSLKITSTDDSTSNLSLGLISDQATWAGGLYDSNGLIEGTIICFNFIYDYQNWGFINWMLLTLICVFALMYLISKGIKHQSITKPRLTITVIVAIMITLIAVFVIGYSKLII